MSEFLSEFIFSSFKNYVILVIAAYVVAGVAWILSRRVASPLFRRSVRTSIIFWAFPIIFPAGHGIMFGQIWVLLLVFLPAGLYRLSFAILGMWVIVLMVATHNVKA